MVTNTASVRLFLGDPISNAAEARCVRRLKKDLSALGIDAVILANFMIGPKRRQIDLVVATQATAIVVEIKAYIHPVHGSVNGPWALELDDGSKKELGDTNPYQQGLENRFTVTDSLRDRDGRDRKEAVGGMLWLYPFAPLGSTVPESDFKLAIGSYADLLAQLRAPRTNALDLAQWRAFAEAHQLKDQSTSAYTAAELVVAQYLAAYQDLGQATLGPYIEPLFDCEQSTKEQGNLIADGTQFQVIGPSGSGKTELLKRLGMACASQGNLPIFIRARDFDREIGPLLRADVARYTSQTVRALFKAAADSGAEIVLHVDALNECPTDQRTDLIAALQAARINFGVRVIVTGQQEALLPRSLIGETITLKQPDSVQAQRIVEVHLGRSLTEHEASALEVVATAHDAAILAEILGEVGVTDGRFALYHAFTQARLGEAAAPHVDRGLAELAMAMRAGFIASFPRATAERIVDSENGVTISAACAAGLLWSQANRIGFRHDLIRDFFAAEALLRRASTSAELSMLACQPIHAELREFLLGGCATTQEIEALLLNAPDSRLPRSALSGRAGTKARTYVISRIRDLIVRLKRRYLRVKLALPEADVGAHGFRSLVPSLPEGYDDDPMDGLYLGLIPYTLGEGLLPDLLDLFGSIDEHLITVAERLREANKELRFAWHAAVFSAIYGIHYSAGPRHLQSLLQAIQNERIQCNAKESSLDVARQIDAFENLSVGQLFLLLSVARMSFDAPMPARVPDLLRHVWKTKIYHLQLLIFDLIQFRGRELKSVDRAAVREILESFLSNENIWINTLIIDALEGVGGIDNSFTVEMAVEEYEAMLALPESPETRSLAVRAISLTYDHPFSAQYSEAFYEALSVEKRQALLLRGLRERPGDPWFITDILRALSRDPTPEVEPELQRLALGPQLDGHSHQFAVQAFVEAISLLATLDLPLDPPEPAPDSPAMRAWYEAAPLIHALNSGLGVRSVESFAACGISEAFDVIVWLNREARRVMFGKHVNVAFEARWPNMVRELIQAVLAKGYIAVSAFDHFNFSRSLAEDHINTALQLMAKVGRPTDLNLIRTWLDHPIHGEQALAAARALEAERFEPEGTQ